MLPRSPPARAGLISKRPDRSWRRSLRRFHFLPYSFLLVVTSRCSADAPSSSRCRDPDDLFSSILYTSTKHTSINACVYKCLTRLGQPFIVPLAVGCACGSGGRKNAGVP